MNREELIELLILEADHGLQSEEAAELARHLTSDPSGASLRAQVRREWRELIEYSAVLAMPEGFGEQRLRSWMRRPDGLLITSVIRIAAALWICVAFVYGMTGPAPLGTIYDLSLQAERTTEQRETSRRIDRDQVVLTDVDHPLEARLSGVRVALREGSLCFQSGQSVVLSGSCGSAEVEVARRKVEIEVAGRRIVTRGATFETRWDEPTGGEGGDLTVRVTEGTVFLGGWQGERVDATSGIRRVSWNGVIEETPPATDDSSNPFIEPRRDLDARNPSADELPGKSPAQDPKENTPLPQAAACSLEGQLRHLSQPLTCGASVRAARNFATPGWRESALSTDASLRLLQISCIDEAQDRLTVGGGWETLSEEGTGRFTIATTVPGWYEFEVLPEDSSIADGSWYRRLFPALEQKVAWDLVCGSTARGRVIDEQGAPIEGATVRSQFREATADEQGEFELQGMDPGGMLARFTWKGKVERAALLAADRRSTITLESGVSIRGVLRDFTGRPMLGQVDVGYEVEGKLVPGNVVFGREGRFEITRVPGDVPLVFKVESRGCVSRQFIHPAQEEITIDLQRGEDLAVLLLEESGVPAAGVDLVAFAGDQVLARASSDSEGSLTLADLPVHGPAHWIARRPGLIQVESRDFALGGQRVVLPEGGFSDLTVVDEDNHEIKDSFALLVLKSAPGGRWIEIVELCSLQPSIFQVPRILADPSILEVELWVGAEGFESARLQDVDEQRVLLRPAPQDGP